MCMGRGSLSAQPPPVMWLLCACRYGDPLRCKVRPCTCCSACHRAHSSSLTRPTPHRVMPACLQVAPDFSCRLLDESYAAQNDTISKIQDVMVEYFKRRPGPLAQSGLDALKQSLAGIYYLPFQAAASLYFRFSGQSIPNR